MLGPHLFKTRSPEHPTSLATHEKLGTFIAFGMFSEPSHWQGHIGARIPLGTCVRSGYKRAVPVARSGCDYCEDRTFLNPVVS